jgi:hypothetical protein
MSERRAMSEYQYYEFQAIDRRLDERALRELRACSTRATITSTRFVNHYEWGDLKGDPWVWMERYFDAFLYVANWGMHWLMLRFPRPVLDLPTTRRYCRGESVRVRAKGDFLILSFASEDESGDGWDDDGSGWLSSLIPVRGDIAAGDHRALYLAWLLAVQHGELASHATEPPVPPGLRRLSARLKAFADFLRIDGDLMAAAAQRSPNPSAAAQRNEIERFVAALPEAEKTAWLVRLAAGDGSDMRGELLRRFKKVRHPAEVRPLKPRTVADLLAGAGRLQETRRCAARARTPRGQ